MAGSVPRELSEKGLLTREDAVVTFLDHQPMMLLPANSHDGQTVLNNTMALAKICRLFDQPVVLGSIESQAFSGAIYPQLTTLLPDAPRIERSTINAWDDENYVRAIEETGRRKIVACGLWTDMCLMFPMLQAMHDGYEVFIVEDCCAAATSTGHTTAMQRLIQAGAKPTTAMTFLFELQRDWAYQETYDAIMQISKEHFGMYGQGIEYAQTMVNGQPATSFPEWTIPD